METTRYIVTVGGRNASTPEHKFTVDTSDALHRDHFGETAEKIARSAADYSDSGSIAVVRADGAERAIVGRR